MSDCNETLRELDRFLDGELTEMTRSTVEHHLGGCMDCLSAFDFHAELKMVIRAKASDETVPTGLRDKILACFGDIVEDDRTIDAD